MRGIKTGGRQKGTPNAISVAIKSQIEVIMNGNFSTDKIQKDLALLEPKDRIAVYLKLLEYAVPKLRSSDINVESSTVTLADLLRD